MSQKRGRWLINLVMILGLVAFVGFSMIPLLGAVFEDKQPVAQETATPTQTPSPSPASGKQAELQAKEKGYVEFLRDEPNNPTALKRLYEVRIQLGDLKGAIEPLEKLAKLNPEETDYKVLLAQAKQYLGDREGSAQAYRDVLASKPGDLKALEGLVGLLMQQNRPEAAIGLLQDTLKTASQANEIQPGSIDVTSVQVLLGKVYAQQKRYTEAVAIFDEAIKTNKQDFQPVLYKALVLKEQGRTAAAKPLFDTAVSLAPAQFKDQIKQLAAETPAPTSSPGTSPSPVPSPSQTPAIPESQPTPN